MPAQQGRSSHSCAEVLSGSESGLVMLTALREAESTLIAERRRLYPYTVSHNAAAIVA